LGGSLCGALVAGAGGGCLRLFGGGDLSLGCGEGGGLDLGGCLGVFDTRGEGGRGGAGDLGGAGEGGA
jgi:hypothetical protein